MSATARQLANTKSMSRTEWLRLRLQGIGGSDAPVIAGVSPYRSPFSLYVEKVDGVVTDEEPTEAQRFGNLLEDTVAKEFARRTGFKVLRKNSMLQSVAHPFQLANVDRVTRDDDGPAIVEVKCRSAFGKKHWDDDQVPVDVVLQTQHYLAVTGYPRAWVVVLLGGNELRFAPLDRDDELIAQLTDLEADFWDRVQRRDPKDSWIDGSESTTDALKALYPMSDPGESVTVEATRWETFNRLRAQLAEVKQDLDAAENELKALMGNAESAYLPGGERPVATWRTQIANRLDTQAIKDHEPKIAALYTKQSTSRVFRVGKGE